MPIVPPTDIRIKTHVVCPFSTGLRTFSKVAVVLPLIDVAVAEDD